MASGEKDTNPKEGPNQYRILEFARSAAVQHAANLLEHVADAKRIRKSFEATFGDDRVRTPNDSKDTSSDLLFDVLRLGARFLNEAARLGHRYKDVSERGLENMYARMAPKTRAPSAETLVFDDQRLQRTFVVENDVNPEAKEVTLLFRGVLDSRLSRYESPFTFRANNRKLEVPSGDEEHPILSIQLDSPFQKPTTVELEVIPWMCAGRQTSADLTIEIPVGSDQVVRRRVPIRIDGRKYDPSPPKEDKSRPKPPRAPRRRTKTAPRKRAAK